MALCLHEVRLLWPSAPPLPSDAAADATTGPDASIKNAKAVLAIIAAAGKCFDAVTQPVPPALRHLWLAQCTLPTNVTTQGLVSRLPRDMEVGGRAGAGALTYWH